jgi:hypothetical protein
MTPPNPTTEDWNRLLAERQDSQNQLRALIQQNQELYQQMQNHTQTLPNVQHRDPKMPDVPHFNGKRKEIRDFQTALHVYFLAQPVNYPPDSHARRIAYAMSRFHGLALAFISTPGKIEMLQTLTYQEFMQTLATHFGDPSQRLTAESRLLRLTQGSRPCSDYATEFLQLVAEAEWTGNATIATFYNGLSPRLKDALVSYERPTDITEAITLATKMDIRLWDKTLRQTPTPFARRASPTPLAYDPMEIGHVSTTPIKRGPLSEQEKQRRRTNNLCMYCGAPGHACADCPAKRKPAPTQGNAKVPRA